MPNLFVNLCVCVMNAILLALYMPEVDVFSTVRRAV